MEKHSRECPQCRQLQQALLTYKIDLAAARKTIASLLAEARIVGLHNTNNHASPYEVTSHGDGNHVNSGNGCCATTTSTTIGHHHECSTSSATQSSNSCVVLQLQLDTLNKEANSLRDQNTELQSDHRVLKSHVAHLESVITSLKGNAVELHRSAADATNHMSSLQYDIRHHEFIHQEHFKERSRLEQEVAAWRRRMEAQERLSDERQETIQTLHQRVEGYEGQIVEYQRTLQQLQSTHLVQREQLESELSCMNAVLCGHEATITQLQGDRAALMNRLAENMEDHKKQCSAYQASSNTHRHLELQFLVTAVHHKEQVQRLDLMLLCQNDLISTLDHALGSVTQAAVQSGQQYDSTQGVLMLTERHVHTLTVQVETTVNKLRTVEAELRCSLAKDALAAQRIEHLTIEQRDTNIRITQLMDELGQATNSLSNERQAHDSTKAAFAQQELRVAQEQHTRHETFQTLLHAGRTAHDTIMGLLPHFRGEVKCLRESFDLVEPPPPMVAAAADASLTTTTNPNTNSTTAVPIPPDDPGDVVEVTIASYLKLSQDTLQSLRDGFFVLRQLSTRFCGPLLQRKWEAVPSSGPLPASSATSTSTPPPSLSQQQLPVAPRVECYAEVLRQLSEAQSTIKRLKDLVHVHKQESDNAIENKQKYKEAYATLHMHMTQYRARLKQTVKHEQARCSTLVSEWGNFQKQLNVLARRSQSVRLGLVEATTATTTSTTESTPYITSVICLLQDLEQLSTSTKQWQQQQQVQTPTSDVNGSTSSIVVGRHATPPPPSPPMMPLQDVTTTVVNNCMVSPKGGGGLKRPRLDGHH